MHVRYVVYIHVYTVYVYIYIICMYTCPYYNTCIMLCMCMHTCVKASPLTITNFVSPLTTPRN